MSKGWLSTRQAAKRLGVSEASVRRWSDRGLLPVQRVGKRLERRYKPEHVERFSAPPRPGPPLAPPPTRLTPPRPPADAPAPPPPPSASRAPPPPPAAP